VDGVHVRFKAALDAEPSIKDLKALFFKLSRGRPELLVKDLKTKIVKYLTTLTPEDVVAFFKLEGVADDVKIQFEEWEAFVGEEWIITDAGVPQMNFTPRLAPAWNPSAGTAIAQANYTGNSALMDERTLSVIEDTAFELAKEDYAKTEEMEAAEAAAEPDYTLYDVGKTAEEVAIAVEQPPLQPEEGLPLLPPPRTESLEPPPAETRKFLVNTLFGAPPAIGAMCVLVYCYFNLNI